jgi:hypothetical protein
VNNISFEDLGISAMLVSLLSGIGVFVYGYIHLNKRLIKNIIEKKSILLSLLWILIFFPSPAIMVWIGIAYFYTPSINTTLSMTSELQKATKTIYFNKNYTSLTDKVIIDSGLISREFSTASELKSPFGKVEIFPFSHDKQFAIILHNIPLLACRKLSQQYFQEGIMISINGISSKITDNSEKSCSEDNDNLIMIVSD